MPTRSSSKPPPGNATLDSWLQAAAVEAQMKRAAELLAQIPAKVAAQLEDHWRELTTRNIELGTELRAKTQQLSAAAAKLNLMEAAMHKLRESESSADVSSIELILQFLRKAFLAAPGM